jgi:hypothetical protein
LNDLVRLNDFDSLKTIVSELLGVEDWNYGTINHVTFRSMYGRGRISGVEISVQDVNPHKKIFRRVFANSNQQISRGRLLMMYRELKTIYDSTIASKVSAREEVEARAKVYNDVACSLKDVKHSQVWSYAYDAGNFNISVCGSEDLIRRVLLFLEQECGRKEEERR